MLMVEGPALVLALIGFLAAAAFEDRFKPRQVFRLRRGAVSKTLTTFPAE